MVSFIWAMYSTSPSVVEPSAIKILFRSLKSLLNASLNTSSSIVRFPSSFVLIPIRERAFVVEERPVIELTTTSTRPDFIEESVPSP